MRLVKRRGIGDALATLLNRKGIDQEMGWRDQALIHSRSRLDGQKLIDQGVVKATAKLR